MNILLSPTKYDKSPDSFFPLMAAFSIVAHHAMADSIPSARETPKSSTSAEDASTMAFPLDPIPGARAVDTFFYGIIRVYEWGSMERLVLSRRCHPLSGLFQLCPGAAGHRISFDGSRSATIILNNCDGPLWQRNVRGETVSSGFNTRSTEPRLQQHDAAWPARCPWRLLLRRFLGREATPPSRSSPCLWVNSCPRHWLTSTPH